MKPDITVVTPSFQSAAWVPLCVASVADQEGVSVEHIVQDAGSTDGTVEWLRQDGRATVFVEADRGMYDAVNRGLKRANGEVVAYLNCDEQYLPSTLARVQEVFDRNSHVDVLFGDAVLIDRSGTPISYRRMVKPSCAHVRWVHLNTLTCSTFFRRSLVEKGILFPPEWKAIGDAIWVHDLLSAGVVCAVLPEPLAAFTFTGENLGASERARQELRKWQGNAWPLKIAPLISFMHRLRKWQAGAYKKRTVDLALFTLTSPNARQRIHTTVGYYWPGAKNDVALKMRTEDI